jgi:hypothetical protein
LDLDPKFAAQYLEDALQYNPEVSNSIKHIALFFQVSNKNPAYITTIVY